jgi:hypothetical protein
MADKPSVLFVCVLAALIGGVAGAALAARSNRVAAALSTIGGATLLPSAQGRRSDTAARN